MKSAQNIRNGNIILIGNTPWIVMRAEYTQAGSGRRINSIVKMKLRNLLTSSNSEQVFKADDRFETIIPDRQHCTYSYYAEPYYIFLDESFNSHELDAEALGSAIHFIEDGLECELVLYQDRPISIELPTTLVRTIEYTEPAVRGDTSGKVLKPATIPSGLTIMVPSFCQIGDQIEIDTRTNEYRNRA